MDNKYKEVWTKMEQDQPLPRRMRNQIIINYEDFKKKVLDGDPSFVNEVIKSLYSGDVYLLKNAFPKEFMANIKTSLHKHGLSTPSSFHKMLEGCSNFHRIIDAEVAKNYTFESIKHSYYFFPWNNDPLNISPETYKRWRIIKYLSGYDFNQYENNTPKDKVADRIQIVHYPSGSGRIETHCDPHKIQRLIISCFMTKRGKDYETGGAYFIDFNNQKVDMENDVEIGDMQIYYPTVMHGVETINEGTNVNWNSIRGRWWLGPFTNSTEHEIKRQTGFGVKNLNNLK